VDVLAGSVETGGEWIHYGLTSSDVLDTAGGVVMSEAASLLIGRVERLFEVVKAQALTHRGTVMLGRTHGIWAEPTTFGLKLATWAFELERDHRRLQAARRSVAVGQISGAVGTYAHCPPQVEEFVCGRLGIGVEPASSQVTMRDRHAELLSAVALTGASVERFATEIRHLQRSEVGEAREPFRAGQKGSSAMPHKRNPIRSERMTGMARLLRGYAQTGLENVALWHERDISHSSAERVALPDACLALDYMLVTFAGVVEGLVVDTERMLANLAATRGLVYSQAVLLALMEEQGLDRDAAYRIVQRNAMEAWDGGRDLRELLGSDPEVDLPAGALERCFSTERFLAHTGVVFKRLEALTL
jgi:adenylosuccinate lyase